MAPSTVLALAEAIAGGNLTGEDLKVASHDELGDLATAMNKMKNSLRKLVQSMANNAQIVASSSEELSSTSQQMSASAEETSSQANVVSAAGEQVNRNLQTVATGSEEMSVSIKEIAKNATEAAKVATGAVRVAENATSTVGKLGESSSEIGLVIKVITSIAQQTNLLALNATIEAARAGEAGKGFRRRGQRSERASETDRQSYRRHQPEDRSDPDRHQERGGRHRHDQRCDHADQRHLQHHRDRGRRTKRHDQRNVPQRNGKQPAVPAKFPRTSRGWRKRRKPRRTARAIRRRPRCNWPTCPPSCASSLGSSDIEKVKCNQPVTLKTGNGRT